MTAAQRAEPGVAVALPAEITKVGFKQDLARWAPQIEKIAYRGFTFERVSTDALNAALKEPKIFAAHPVSLYHALCRVARLGLVIGDTIHLVPLNVKVSKKGEPDRWMQTVDAWPDYKGLKALAIRERIVRGMEEFVVYEGDRFEYQLGLDAFLRHGPNGDPAKRGAIIGAYTIIRLPFGERTFNYMPIQDIEAIRAKSKSWSPDKGIKICPAWYAKKTVVRDYLNRQPKQGALNEALAADDTEEGTPFDSATGEVLQHPATQSSTEEDLEFDRILDERG